MKSLVNTCLGIASGLYSDIKAAYPDQKCGVDRDMQRYSLCIRTRGLGFVTLDLPAMDDMLTAGLRSGRLIPSNCKIQKGTQVPAFMQGLWLRVFDNEGFVLEDVDTTAIFFLRQLFCMFKKVELECKPYRIKTIIEEYIHVDNSLYKPTLRWVEDDLDPCDDIHRVHFRDIVDLDLPLFPGNPESRDDRRTRTLLSRLQSFCDEFSSALPCYAEWAELTDPNWGHSGERHGPGAVAERKYRWSKFACPNYPAKLNALFPHEVYSTSSERINHEVPSRLICVPKTQKGPRLIASEPTWHQVCQQSLLAYFNDFFRSNPRFGIDLKDQSKSRLLAKRSSYPIDHKGRLALATVDLSSASDRLSCYVVERAFRKHDILFMLHATRSRAIEVNIRDKRSKKRKSRSKAYFPRDIFFKNKFASQGSAVTFPVQTIVFAMCAFAACSREGESLYDVSLRLKGKVQVFGDDIILPTQGYNDLLLILTALQLKVNREKSFASGFFRESCGGDFAYGDCVTPVKPKVISGDGPNGVESAIDFVNNLFEKGLWQTSEAARMELLGKLKLPISSTSMGSKALRSFVGSHTNGCLTRWNVDLQRFEYNALVFSSSLKDKEVLYKKSYPIDLIRHCTHKYKPTSRLSHLDIERDEALSGITVSKMKRQWVAV